MIVRLAESLLAPGGGDAALGYRVALIGLAAAALLSTLEGLRLPRGAGDALRAGR